MAPPPKPQSLIAIGTCYQVGEASVLARAGKPEQKREAPIAGTGSWRSPLPYSHALPVFMHLVFSSLMADRFTPQILS
jgi:hypothetical protein